MWVRRATSSSSIATMLAESRLTSRSQVSVSGSHLSDKGATISTDCTTYSLGCNSTALTQFANSTVNQALSTFLKPYPFNSPSDSFGYVGNADYHGVQVMANMRAWHG